MARRRRSLGLLTAIWLLVIGAAIWSAGWFYVRNVAETLIDQGLAREAQAGRTIECGARSFGGFPLGLVFRCEGAQLVVEDQQGRSRFAVPAMQAEVSVFDLAVVDVDVTPPVEIDSFRLGGVRRQDRIDAKSLGIRLGVVDDAVDSVTVTAAGVEAAIGSLGLALTHTGTRLSAETAMMRVREVVADSLDIHIEIASARIAGELASVPFETETIDARRLGFLGRLTRRGRLDDRSPMVGLAEWQQAGGELQIERLNVDAEALDMGLSGIVKLDPAGRPEGKLRGRFGRLDALIAEFKARGILDDDGARIAASAVGLLARPTADGARAELPVRLSGGEVYLGPIKTMVLPAFF